MHCDNTCKQDPTRALIHLLLAILCTLCITAHPLPDALRYQVYGAAAPQIEAPSSTPSIDQSMLQFTAGGHVLGFRTEEVWIASKDHVLQLAFLGANRVEPTSSQSTTGESQAQPLSQVTYHRLWQDIDLLYRTDESGLFQTEYLLRPGAQVEDIRLSSNVPASLDDQGSIVFTFESGEMRQAAPIAWQFIDNQKTSVPVTYNLVTTREIGFRLGKHDPAVPLAISLVLTWHTFLGATSMDSIAGIAVLSADIYVTGTSEASWGSPLNPHSGGDDIFVAELDPENGSLTWNTFLGGAGDDKAQEIVNDPNVYGMLYIIGESDTGWGTPVRAYSGG